MRKKIDKDAIIRLQSGRTQRIREATRILIENGDLEKAKEALAWVDISSRLLATIQRPFPRLISSAIIAFICLFIVGLAWTTHIRVSEISFEVITDNVSMTLSKDWFQADEFPINGLYINTVAELSAPGLNLSGPSGPGEDGLIAVRLDGAGTIVSRLTFKEDARVELTALEDRLRLFIRDSPLTGELALSATKFALEKGGGIVEASMVERDIPEDIYFRTAKTVGYPALFEVFYEDNLKLSGLHVQKIGFLEEDSSDPGRLFASAISSGKVKLLETGMTEELRESDLLDLKGVKSRRLEICTYGNKLRVSFEGSVTKILSGPLGFEKNLAPKYLEYLYYQESFAFFWGAVVFIWGLLWSVKNFISDIK